MNRLKHILLAGTLVPALILTPLVTAGAQAPDPGEHHGKRKHEGGEHSKRSEAGGQKGEAREHKGERAEKAERRQSGTAAKEDKADKPNRAAGNDGPRGDKRKQREAEGADTPSKAERAQNKAERAQNREDRQDRKAGRAGAEDRDTGSRKAERQDKRNGDQDRGTPAKADRDQNRKTGERDNNPRGDRDSDRKMGDRNKDRDSDRKMGDRKKDRDPDRKMGDRDRDRDQDRKTGERNRDHDDRGPDRDNARRNDEPGNRRVGQDRDDRRGGSGAPGRPASVGFAGGFLPAGNARRIDDLRRDRREVREGDSVFIREPGRTIVQEHGRAFIVHDENDRFRALGYDVRRERRGDQFIDTVRRPNGDVILTYTDDSGRLLRRVRRGPGGKEVVLIENGVGGRIRPYAEDVVVLPPPPMRIPRDRYVVDYRAATPALIYDALSAPPVAPPPQRYTLDQIRYSPDVRNYVRQVDINSINFDSGSWDVPAAATGNLEALATGMNKAIARNPDSVFLIEGYTDATGDANDNLSLSDHRAQAVAEILTKDFKIPPENLTTQGYGQQNPKEDTQGPSAANRRVVVRNITQLMASGEGQPAGQ